MQQLVFVDDILQLSPQPRLNDTKYNIIEKLPASIRTILSEVISNIISYLSIGDEILKTPIDFRQPKPFRFPWRHPALGTYATISMAWQGPVEYVTFSRINVTNDILPKFKCLLIGNWREALRFINSKIHLALYRGKARGCGFL